jgi:dienelactone hydrolase
MTTTLTTLHETKVDIPCHQFQLKADIAIPSGARGVVVFAHGSGSGRLSPRNRLVAAELHRKGLATLLFDLITPDEAMAEATTGELRFNIPLLTDRLAEVVRWVRGYKPLASLGIGLFGASTGAAAALAVAAINPDVQAVVSRGGRTDLAGDSIVRVDAPTLLIAGALDVPVIRWNEETLAHLRGIKHLVLIPGAGHLFPEPGTLEHVAQLAGDWFERYLSPINEITA